jgi:predicted Fe-Mo cluster-binding NifX family protein
VAANPTHKEIDVRICIPITEDHGLESVVCEHFGSAPMFMVVDTSDGTCRALANHHAHHEHGMCQPLAALEGEAIEGIVVGGIGRNALARLQQGGIGVFRSEHETVAQTVAAFNAGSLPAVSFDQACGGRHGHAHGA